MSWTCTSTQRGLTCFPGTTNVIGLGGTVKQLSQVSVGDYVQVVDHGQLTYEKILGFLHSEPNDLYDYLSIDVDMLNNETTVLEISFNHLVFLYNKADPVFAGKLKIGQQLEAVYDGHIGPGIITKIKLTRDQGYFAPLTSSGTIVLKQSKMSQLFLTTFLDPF
ncbi:unnamed protein product [Didymodactylos carnosus]|uniref:Hedgehog protein Hint domain-containing protein n=1 Tax=Didymodactylos carnosus TaxID=1234261 RepID=A0A8S2F2Y0_9BILA|nr:unnamed protein product [Didymodactylos carnosus]CAF4175990.1 unnamed protein product [Didymodactylos carnosus]